MSDLPVRKYEFHIMVVVIINRSFNLQKAPFRRRFEKGHERLTSHHFPLLTRFHETFMSSGPVVVKTLDPNIYLGKHGKHWIKFDFIENINRMAHICTPFVRPVDSCKIM